MTVIDIIDEANIWLFVIVNIFPNRNDMRLGAYPGLRAIKIIPNAIPVDQNIPMRESSLRLVVRDSLSIPKPDKIANIVAPKKGGKPR